MRHMKVGRQDAGAELSQTRNSVVRVVVENLFEVAPDAILVTDAEGIIRDGNSRVQELFGYSRDELIGHPIEKLIPQRFHKRHKVDRADYSAHPRVRPLGTGLGFVGLRKSGREFPADVVLKPIESPSGTMVLSFVRDETEKRLAQDELHRTGRQMRAVVESIREFGFYLMDVDGNIQIWNSDADANRGYSREEVIGRHFSMFFVQEDIEQGKPAELLRLAGKYDKVVKEGWRVRKDGERIWVEAVVTAIRDETGAVTGYAKVVRDITRRKRAQEAVLLRLSAALLANEDLDMLLQAISASLHDLIPHDLATLGTVNLTEGFISEQFLSYEASEGRPEPVRIPLAGSQLEEAVRTGEPFLISNFDESKFGGDAYAQLRALGMKSACWVPLIFHGETQGTILLASRQEGNFEKEFAEMLMEIGGSVAVALRNSKQLRQISEVRDKLDAQKRYLEEEINLENHFDDIVGESTGLRQVLTQIEIVAPTDATVLIEGETGTGKELLARAIHRLSRRSNATFIKLNCAAIPSGLIESELFGHEKGAFTGAILRKIGKLELAHEGTLFLDEIGELPLDLQPKLLRALQEHEIERLGSNQSIHVNLRLIVATNRNLSAMVTERKFRSDLYYRLKVFPILAPPLRERKSDIPSLVRHFVAMHSRNIGKTIDVIPVAAMAALVECKWPGNIRELENFIERCVILTKGKSLLVPVADLHAVRNDVPHELGTHKENEREHIVRVLRDTQGRVGGIHGAAGRLGLKRTTLNSKMKKLGIRKSDFMTSV